MENAVLVLHLPDYLLAREAVNLPDDEVIEYLVVGEEGSDDSVLEVPQEVSHVGVEVTIGLLLEHLVVVQEERHVVWPQKRDEAVRADVVILVEPDVLWNLDVCHRPHLRVHACLGGDASEGGLQRVALLVLRDYLLLQLEAALASCPLELRLQGFDDRHVLGNPGNVGDVVVCDGASGVQQGVLVVDDEAINAVLAILQVRGCLLERRLTLLDGNLSVLGGDGILVRPLPLRRAGVRRLQQVVRHVGELRVCQVVRGRNLPPHAVEAVLRVCQAIVKFHMSSSSRTGNIHAYAYCTQEQEEMTPNWQDSIQFQERLECAANGFCVICP